MIKEKKGHVGRPSNKELRDRKIKKILMYIIPIFIVLVGVTLISSGSLNRLMGNSITRYVCEDSTYTLNGNKCTKLLKEKANVLGDVNKDGTITTADVMMINVSVKKVKALDDLEKALADVNKDGNVDENDITIVSDYVKGISNDNYKVGTEKICSKGYTLNGDYCEKTLIVDAKLVQEDIQDNDNEQTNQQEDKTQEEQTNNQVTPVENKDTFTVNFNSNGGTGTMASIEAKYEKENKTPKNTFTKENNVFSGWYVQNDETKQWQCYLDSSKKKENWADDDTCNKYGKVLRRDETIVQHTTTPGKSVTFYAQWVEGFKIKFVSNGGTGEMTDQAITYGVSIPIKKNNFSKSGYGFAYWTIYNATRDKWLCYNANKEERYLSEKECTNGYVHRSNEQKIAQTALKGEELHFYAQWTNEFTIKFISHGGVGTMSNQNITYGTSTLISANKFTRSGYKFAYWTIYNETRNKWLCYNANKEERYLSEKECTNGYVHRSDKQSIKQTAKPGEVLQFYAQWTKLSSSGSSNTSSSTNNSNSCKNKKNATASYYCGPGYLKIGDGPTSYCRSDIKRKLYVCDQGYEKVGDGPSAICRKVLNYKYSCPSGYTKIGDGPTATCQKQTGTAYGCDSGYEKIGDGPNATCRKAINYTYTCSSGYTKVGDGPNAYCQKKTGTAYTCPSGYTKIGDGPTATCRKVTTYSYSCPSGYTKVGDGSNAYCQKKTGTSYTCPSGYTKIGDGPSATCRKVSSYTYSCPSGYTKSGTTCRKKTSTTYSCPSGYKRSGTWCYLKGKRKMLATPKVNYNTKTATKKPNYTTTKVTAKSVYTKTSTIKKPSYSTIKATAKTVYNTKSIVSKANYTTTAAKKKTVYDNKPITKTPVYENGKISEVEDYITTSIKTKYSCPSGYSLNGKSCCQK